MSAHLRAEHLMTESIDFRLTPGEQAELDDHLAACATCRARNGAFSSDAADLRRIAFVVPPAGVRGAILEGASTRRSKALAPWQLFVAAALVIMSILGAAAAMGALNQQPRLGVVSTARPSANPSARPAASARPSGGLAVRCGPLEGDQVRCFQLVANSATGLSSDWQGETILAVAVQGGSTFAWCAPPDPCISPPPDSFWVTFNSAAGWERIPVYGDGGEGWLLGVPVGTDGP